MNRFSQDASQSQSTAYFYIRQQLWATLGDFCDKQFDNINDPFFAFWRAFAYFKEDKPNDAINVLTSVKQRKEIEYATIQALKFYHKKCDFVDDEAIQQLRYQEEESRKTSSDKAIILAAYFFLYLKEEQKALDYLEMVQVKGVPSQTCEGWIFLLHSEEPNIEKAFEIFQNCLESQGGNMKPIDTQMGFAQAAYSLKKFTVASDTINELVVTYPDFMPAQYTKAEICMMIAGWVDYKEIADKLVYEDEQNILAQKLLTFYTIARQGDIEYGTQKLENLVDQLLLKEPNNSQQMLQIAELFSRISGRSERILQITIGLLKKCREIQPLNADFAIELGNEYMMLEDYKNAYSLFSEGAALDESKIEALTGMIFCKIYQGDIDDAEQQLIFMKEVQVSMGRTSTIAFLEGLLNSKKQGLNQKQKQQATMKYIEEALKMHIMSTKQLLPTFQFYIKLNPDFLLQLSQVYLQSVGMKQMLEGSEQGNNYVAKGTKLLETILRQIPGYLTGYLLVAKGKMALGDFAGASQAINKVLEMDQINEDAYILQSLILTKNGNFQGAQHSLQEAISNNFQIRENPLFMLVKGEVEFAQKDYEAALQTATAAFEINGVKNKGSGQLKSGNKQSLLQFQEKDRCRIFLLLAKAFAANKKNKESKQVMAKAISEWTGTEEEVNVLIANSEIAIQSGDIKKAIAILKGVKPDSPYFQQSRVLLAEIHLEHLRDRRQFARCYTDLIDADPSFENYKLLGDALIKIREPEDAAKAYEQALQVNPGDESIVKSLGEAYCQTYNYEKAIRYYENELRTKQNLGLIVDLANLCIQIKNYKRAEELLQPQLFAPDDFKKQTIEQLKTCVDGFVSIAKLQLEKQGKDNFQPNENVRKAYKSAITVQKDVIEKCKTDGGDIEQNRHILADLLIDLAEYISNHERNDQASLQVLEDAQKQLPQNEKITELKAKIFYRMGELTQCSQMCNILSKISPNNDFATLMQADIQLQKEDYDQAISQFKVILEQNPTKYGILAKIIDFYHRQFNLEEAKKQIEKAEQAAINNNDAGLCFCRGLYHKYMRNPKEALREFSKAKKVSQYAEDSLAHMIDLYLNPDQDMYYSQVEEGLREVPASNIKACENLLREMKLRASYHRCVVMESLVLYMGKYEKGVETAVQKLTNILKQRQDYIPAMLALAIGKLLQKKQTDAKNLLKMLSKKQYSSEFAEDLERAWLLHADTFIAIQKYDNAEEILKKCLKHNQSCGKAEEFMGLIKEKEHSYIDAAVHYEKAHKLNGEKSASVGFRLAFNFLKAKRYIDCINVCTSILQVFPDYPKIEKEVLQKAVQALK